MNAAEEKERGLTWFGVQEQIRGAVGEDHFRRWFESVTGSIQESPTGSLLLQLVVPTKFQCEWVENHYGDQVRRVWQGLTSGGEVLFTAQKNPKPDAQLPAKVIQLPLWPEPVRGLPNPVLRAALFAAIQGKNRRFINGETVAAVQGITIRFKGEQLNQEDLEVCAAAYHLARLHPLGDTVHTTAHGFLKLLGRKTGKSQHVQLYQSFFRLMQPLEIETQRYQYGGALVMEGVKDKETRHYVIKINPKLAPLFGQGWTGLDWEQRQRLRGKPLALWLHGFYATHDDPYPYKVETLRTLSGGHTATLYKFRQNLRRALAELEDVGAIQGYEIDATDLVHIRKAKTISSPPKNTA